MTMTMTQPTVKLRESVTETKPPLDSTCTASTVRPSPSVSRGSLNALEVSTSSEREAAENTAWPDLLDASEARNPSAEGGGGCANGCAADDSFLLVKTQQASPLAALDELLARLRCEPSPAAVRRAASAELPSFPRPAPSEPVSTAGGGGGEQVVLVDGLVQLVHRSEGERASGHQQTPALSPAYLFAADKYFAACSHCSGKLQSL